MKTDKQIKERLQLLRGIRENGKYATNLDLIRIEAGIGTLKWVLDENA